MAGGGWNKQHLTASAVVWNPGQTAHTTAPAPAILHSVLINTGAATAVIAVYDDNTTTSPQNLIASITIPTAPVTPVALDLDCVITVGITITIATAAADVTVLWA